SQPRPERILMAAQALRAGLSVEEIHAACRFEPWFLRELQKIVAAEHAVVQDGLPRDAQGLRRLKAMGFSDVQLGRLSGTEAHEIAALRARLAVAPVYKRIDTCAGEFASATPYMYSTYEGGFGVPECESRPTGRRKIVILGGGPNRIGQGIEFDYCCVHAAYALREAGFETIMVNCNPETVSTDYDTSDRLYFEPLTAEDVIGLIRREQEQGEVLGCIVQYGGQTPLKLSRALEAAGIALLGTPADAIDRAEDRERF
ncbi:carbamoyl phosphate synthase preATP-grasp domain-containing protein, partial [Nguyenibacter vanlangensis]|nr:carbamoyl phosphate synthase large subunit [Nguyenibacter vanlangensis]